MRNIHIALFTLIVILAFLLRLYKLDNPIADWHSFRQADTSAVTRNFIKHGVTPLTPRYDDLSNIQSGKDNPQGYRMVEFPIYNLLHYSTYKLGTLLLPECVIPSETRPEPVEGVEGSLEISLRQLADRNDKQLCLTLESAGRLTTIIASLVSLTFLYLIVNTLSGPLTALITAFIFAILPYNIYYSRTILPDPLMVTFSLGSVWFFLKETSLTDKNQLPVTSYQLLSSLSAALALLIKPTAIFLLAPLSYLFFIHLKDIPSHKSKTKTLVLSSLFIVLSFAPLFLWRHWIKQFPTGIPAWEWLLNSDNIRLRPAWFHWLFHERLGNLILGGFGLVPFIVGIISSHPERSRGISEKQLDSHKQTFFQRSFDSLMQSLRSLAQDDTFYFIWLLSALAYLTIIATGNVRHDYYQILLIPIICIYFARGLVAMWTNLNFNKLLSIPISLILIPISFFISWYQIRTYYQINNPAIIAAGRTADQLLPPDAKVIAPYFGDTAFLYQTNRSGWPLVTHYPIQAMIDRGATHYVSVTYDDYTKELIEQFPIIKQTEKYIIIKLSSN